MSQPGSNRPSPKGWTRVSSGLPIGVALGAGIWILSASVTGHSEPWDAPGMYYPAALLAAGVIGGSLVPAHWAEVAIGVFTGQAVVLLARVLAEATGSRAARRLLPSRLVGSGRRRGSPPGFSREPTLTCMEAP